MSDPLKARQTLERKVADLLKRVKRLERGVTQLPERPAPLPAPADLALLDRLRSLKEPRYQATGLRGAVTYAGSATFGDREHLWMREHALPDIMDLDPAGLARALATLGHPTRLTLLRTLLREPCSSQRLQEVLGVSSAGPLYHHLKELLAVGLVVQTRRSLYEVPAHHVIPLLLVLAAAADCLANEAAPTPSPGPAASPIPRRSKKGR